MSDVVTFSPSRRKVECEGCTVLEAARTAGIALRSLCGGKGRCGKCMVRIGGYTTYTEEEKKVFTEDEMKNYSHLACQTVVKGDMTVEIPPQSLLEHQRILVEGYTRKVRLDPVVKKVFVKIPPSLQETRTDAERIADIMHNPMTTEALQNLPLILADSSEVTLVIRGNEIVDCERGDTTDTFLGVAFDLGTTTLVGYLVDLNTGERLAASARMNPQTERGDDIISRISFSQTEGGLEVLTSSLREALSHLVDDLLSKAGKNREDVYEYCAAGNSFMHHVVLGIPPRSLAVSPFTPVVRNGLSIPFLEREMYVLPLVSGFVGGDAIADVLAYPFDDEVRFLIDIGTNCEVLIGTNERIMACSAAAGPAFEGSHIACGMRASPGAVEQVHFDKDVIVTTVEDAPPRGIAGSGLVSAAAEMVLHHVIDSSGRIQTDHAFSSRVREGAFFLTDTVYITQKDIRELQMAKGALFAAQRILLKRYGISAEKIAEIVLAGAFGSYLSPEAAQVIGMILDVPTDHVKSVGNAAGVGAQLCLVSRDEREKADTLSESIEYVELSLQKDFQEEFVSAMSFPHAHLELFPSVRKLLSQERP